MDEDDIPAEKDPLRLSRGITMMGDIAILSLPPGLDAAAADIAAALVVHRKNIRRCFPRSPLWKATRRVARYRIPAGSSTVTVHREFGFSYALDVREVFFTPRRASERMRVALQVFFGEEVLVPFAGAAPFVVPVAAREGAGRRRGAEPRGMPVALRTLPLQRRGGDGVRGRRRPAVRQRGALREPLGVRPEEGLTEGRSCRMWSMVAVFLLSTVM
ncbi:MAG: hypothetical protein QCH35_06070 [Methanomicrobiaceae archaeon]|nr:hypothetical protein [Methanomicrobiaceae archaeon]